MYRIQEPLDQLSARGWVDAYVTSTIDAPTVHRLRHGADVFVVQRARYSPELAAIYAMCRKWGVKIAYEVDDDLVSLLDVPSLRARVSAADVQGWKRAMEEADWIIASTPVLAERYSRFNAVRLAPNQFPYTPPPLLRAWSAPFPRPQPVFYAGGDWHAPDWSVVAAPLGTAIRGYVAGAPHRRVEVHLMGATWAVPPDALDRRLRYVVSPARPWGEYMESLRHAEVALMTLEANLCTDAKSDVKFLVAAAAGVAAE